MRLKKILSLLAVMAMLLSSVNFTVFAEDGVTANNSVETIDTMAKLVEAVKSANSTITVGAVLTVAADETYKLDLNGCTVNMGAHYIENKGTLTITNGKVIADTYNDDTNGAPLCNNGNLKVYGNIEISGVCAAVRNVSGTCVIEDGTFEATCTLGYSASIIRMKGGSLTINGGNFYGCNNVNPSEGCSIISADNGTTVINGGTFNNFASFPSAIFGAGTGVTVKGGTFNFGATENYTYQQCLAKWLPEGYEVGVDGVVSKTPVTPKGDLKVAYVTDNYNNKGKSGIRSDAYNVVGTESFEVKLYSGEKLVGTAKLKDENKVLLCGKPKTISWHILIEEDDEPSWWDTDWVTALNVNEMPDKVELHVDGVKVSEGEIKLNSPDNSFPIFAAVTDKDGNVQSFVAADGYVNNQQNIADKLIKAIDAAKEGDKVVLLRDITVDDKIFLQGGKNVTIEGAGKTITFKNTNYGFAVKESTLTLGKGLNIIGEGQTCPLYVQNGTAVTSANIKTVDGNGYSPIMINGGFYANVTINDGEIVAGDARVSAIYWPGEGTLTVNDGKITGSTAIYLKSGNLTIIDGELVGNGEKKEYKYEVSNHTPTGDALVIENVGIGDYDPVGTVSITGGTFTSDKAAAVASYAATSVNPDAKVETGFISGGTFSSDVSELCAEGFTVEKNDDGTFGAVKKEGLSGSGKAEDPYKIGTKEELFFFAEKVNDGTYKGVYVVLTDDIDLEQDDWTSIGTSKNPFTGTFDGNGKKIFNLWSYERGLFGYTGYGNYVDGPKEGRATIKNLTVDGTEVYNQSTSAVGGIVGQAGQNTELSNIKLTGQIQIFGYGYVGGIVGQGYVHMDNCHVDGISKENSEINAAYWAVGGIVGHAGSEGGAVITNCSVKNIQIYSAIYGAGAIAGVGTSGPIENVSAESVAIEAQRDPDANGYLVGCNYKEITGDSTVSDIILTVDDKVVVGADVVAMIGDDCYFQFADAIAEAKDGDTVKLLQDVALADTLIIDKEGAITIDGNEKKITLADSFTNTNSWGAAIMVGNSNYGDADTANHSVTIKNVTFDSITGNSIIRSQGVALTVDGCTVTNCDSTNSNQGMFRIDSTVANIKDSDFNNNKATKIIGHNHNTSDSSSKLTIDNCEFKSNIITGPGVVVLSSDAGCTINDSEFVENNVTCTNGATVYLGFTENNVITGNLFKSNTVTGNASNGRVAGALFVGYTNEISNNAFESNVATNSGKAANEICIDTIYATPQYGYELDIDISGNYFNGQKPEKDKDYTVLSEVDTAYSIDSYYTKYAIENGNVVFEEEDLVSLNNVAQIGDVKYPTLAKAIEEAEDGDTVIVIADIENEAISVDKNLTITGNVSANNVTINAVEGCGELTVSGISFTGNSWINSGAADKLTVSGVTADVTPSNGNYTNSRSAFISLGKVEQHNLDLTVENCNIVSKGGTDPILGWAAITKATITGNTFGSASAHQANSDSVKFMAIAKDAEFTITGNTVYSDYNGFVFGQNTTRDNAYTAFIDNNTFIGSADHVWIEVSGAKTTHATINATSSNTVNGEKFTASDIKTNVPTWTSYAGVDVVTDENGKVIGGTLAFVADDAIADDYAGLPDLDGNYVVGETPTATVKNLGAMTIPAGEHYIYNGSLTTGTVDMPLNFVMQFVADQNAEDMKTSPYADWYADFVITFDGIEGDSFDPTGCYLAGYYGSTESWDGMWVKIPVDGLLTSIDEGARYPVMMGVGMAQRYDYICSGVQAFSCAMFIPEEILAANPNLKVNLELNVVDSSDPDKALEALQTGTNIYKASETEYTAEDFKLSSAKVAYRAYVTNTDARKSIQIDLKNVKADKSLVIELYSGNTLISKTNLKEAKFPVDAEDFTVNAVWKGELSGSWDTEWYVDLTEDNIPDTIKVYADGTLTDTYSHATGTIFADKLEEYKAMIAKEEITLDTKASFVRNIKTKNSAGEERYQVILFAGIDSLKYSSVGFEITVNGETRQQSTKTVYESYTAAGVKYTPDAWGKNCNYIISLPINFNPELRDSTVTFRPFAVTLKGDTLWGPEKTIDKIYNK